MYGGKAVVVTFVPLTVVKLSSGMTSKGSSIDWLKSITLKTAQAAMSDVVIKKIASRIDRTLEMTWPGPLFPGSDVTDIS
jgi:hypothetical protein